MRKIIVMNKHEWLHEAFSLRSMSTALPQITGTLRDAKIRFVEDVYPVELQEGFALAAEFDSEDDVEALALENEDEVQGVYSDPQIGLFGVVCPQGAVGDATNVQSKLNLGPLQVAGATGTGVKIIVVDTGIDGTQINVVGGWSPRPGSAPGTTQPDHGTMVAFDAQIAAPNSMIFDYALLQSQGNTWVAFLSDAIRAFSEIMIDHLQNPGPKVVVNSWGMYNTVDDAQPGNPQNYSSNESHPFNQITGALVGSGVDVVFAAGNCGSTCPASRCGQANIGPGNSIHGANSHPDVMSVAAVTINDDLLGYSSEGPGLLTAEKPDVAGFSHFDGSGVFPADTGTSAACPVVAGVLAALRSSPAGRSLSPSDLKDVVKNNARSLHGPGWDPQFGRGIIDAGSAFNAL